jgi:hypothetical protein
MRPTGLQLPRDVFSGGHFGQHEPKFNRDFKGLFSQAYRKFESPLVRHEVLDITRETKDSEIVP